MSELFTINNVDPSAFESARKRYRWYHDYLHPMATLFNAKLGDNDGEVVSFSASAAETPLPETFHETLLSTKEQASLTELLAGIDQGEGGEAKLADAIGHDPTLGPKAEFESFGLFGSDYDDQTGVPSAEVPGRVPGDGLLSIPYRIQRAGFSFFNGRVTKDVTANPPPLRGPSDYQRLYETYLADSKKTGRFGGKVFGFDGFADMYASNEMFGWQRIAGTNPRALMRLGDTQLVALRAKMPLTDAHLQAVAGAGATIDGEAAASRLYYCDYSLLAGMPLQQGRYLPPAIGVFWSDVAAKQLRPVAIQLQQTPGKIHIPTDSDWASARAFFNIADFTYHEMGTHLSEAHFSQEAFIVAARRNFVANHPIGALLSEVYWGLLYNNALGRILLVNRGGYVERMMAGVLLEGSVKLVRNYFDKVWQWDDWNLERYLARQGTNDVAGLPVYPYRDDGLPLWSAIVAFASEYVNAWYGRDAEVANDRQLEGFIGELNNPEMGNLTVKGFPQKVLTKQGLVEVLARLIWQAGPGHGGINYSQYQYFGAIASAPGAGYADFSNTEQLPPLMNILPPIEQSITQQDILNTLTQKVFGRLGVYSSDFQDGLSDAAKKAVENFQAALHLCAQQVDGRNASDARKGRGYAWLHPNNLPNSTNI